MKDYPENINFLDLSLPDVGMAYIRSYCFSQGIIICINHPILDIFKTGLSEIPLRNIDFQKPIHENLSAAVYNLISDADIAYTKSRI
jgi:hypothetical protein